MSFISKQLHSLPQLLPKTSEGRGGGEQQNGRCLRATVDVFPRRVPLVGAPWAWCSTRGHVHDHLCRPSAPCSVLFCTTGILLRRMSSGGNGLDGVRHLSPFLPSLTATWFLLTAELIWNYSVVYRPYLVHAMSRGLSLLVLPPCVHRAAALT